MILWLFIALTVLVASSFASQPTAPKPQAAPIRELQYGQINFLHTTDTHGWHAGHLLEASYSADWGDYIDFAGRLREKLETEGRDLLLIDTGDRIEGNGLYDASDPRGKYLFDIVEEQHIDVICSGNHELYKQTSSEDELNITVPAFKENYLASNLDIQDPDTGEFIPLAPRFRKFMTPKQGIRIMAFGFLFDFQGNYNNTRVITVEKTLQESWFQEAIRDREIDLFVVAGHAGVRSEEFVAVYKAIRSVQWDVAIQFFGGHVHVRDYKKFDAKSYGLASGRFMETIGFQSIDNLPTQSSKSSGSPTFFRRYIDSNLYSYYHHTGLNSSEFHSEHGRNVSKAIQKARTALDLDQTYGCATNDLWMSRVKYPSKDSIYTWLEEQVLPDMVNDTSRPNAPRLIITNTGAIRFDVFKGAFTKDSTFIVSPFTSGFRLIKDVPYDKATKILALLNGNGQIFKDLDGGDREMNLAPSQQLGEFEEIHLESLVDYHDQIQLGFDTPLLPGYTTKDDAGDEGDDTIHSPIPSYRVPNCIQAIVNTTSGDLEGQNVDVIFNEFMQPWMLLALRFLGQSYTKDDVSVYMNGVSFTSLLSQWVHTHWAKNCNPTTYT